MPSTAEDMSFAYGDDSRVMKFSKYALLNIPKFLDNSADNNTIQLDAIPGAYLQVTGSDWNRYLTESFQNYFLNQNEIQGEFVICVNLLAEEKKEISINEAAKEALFLVKKGIQLKSACKDVAQKHNLNAKDIYNESIKKS